MPSPPSWHPRVEEHPWNWSFHALVRSAELPHDDGTGSKRPRQSLRTLDIWARICMRIVKRQQLSAFPTESHRLLHDWTGGDRNVTNGCQDSEPKIASVNICKSAVKEASDWVIPTQVERPYRVIKITCRLLLAFFFSPNPQPPTNKRKLRTWRRQSPSQVLLPISPRSAVSPAKTAGWCNEMWAYKKHPWKLGYLGVFLRSSLSLS